MHLSDAITIVLDDAGAPLSQQEITRRLIDRKLWITSGKTPAATVGAKLYVDINKHGSASRFQLAGKNQFALRKWGLPEYTSDSRKSHGSPMRPAPLRTKQPRSKPRTERKRKSSAPPQNQVYSVLGRELDTVRAFLAGRSDHRPTDEKICDWIQFCYTLELYSDASALFKLVAPDSVHPWYYERTRKLAKICDLRAQR